jgi:hypothetical protein
MTLPTEAKRARGPYVTPAPPAAYPALTMNALRLYFSLRATNHPVAAAKIAVSRAFGVSIADLDSRRRTQPLARIRQIAMAIVRLTTKIVSTAEIGRRFHRDPKTVTAAVARQQAMIVRLINEFHSEQARGAVDLPTWPWGRARHQTKIDPVKLCRDLVGRNT